MSESQKEIRCPNCGEYDCINFEGVASIPVYVGIDGMHYWDWDNAEIEDERGYTCSECDATELEPEDFIQDKPLTTGSYSDIIPSS